MSFSELVCWPWNRTNLTEKREAEPFLTLQEEINHLFDRFFNGPGMMPTSVGKIQPLPGSFMPKVDVS